MEKVLQDKYLGIFYANISVKAMTHADRIIGIIDVRSL